jgi:hypothetical protein
LESFTDYVNPHLFEMANLKFVMTTHNSLFYNVLYNETGAKAGHILTKYDDGNFEIEEKKGDSNKSFSYHLYLIETIELAIKDNKVEKFHFTLLRNLYEKTASFLGYPKWSELLPSDGQEAYLRRIVNFTSHSTLSNETVAMPTVQEKKAIELYMFFKSDLGQSLLKQLVAGVAMPLIATSEIKQLNIPILSDVEKKQVLLNFSNEIKMYNEINKINEDIQQIHSNFLGAE